MKVNKQDFEAHTLYNFWAAGQQREKLQCLQLNMTVSNWYC